MNSAKTLTALWVLGAMLVAGVFVVGPLLGERMAYAQAASENQAVRDALPGMAQAEQLSKLFRHVAKAVSPAVVEIRVTKTVQAGDPYREFFEGLPPGMRDRFRAPSSSREFTRRGLGSGVIVDAQKGYVLTNNHVVADADKVQVVLADGRTLTAENILCDPKTDLAVMTIPAEGLISAPLGDSDTMEVGDWVVAIGSPEGLKQSVTAGIISAKGRRTQRGANSGQYENYLQTDAAINHGNSGGPLVNMRGEVIGVNTAIVTPTGAFAGIGLSIPSNLVKGVMAQLIDKGRVSRGFLGIQFESADDGVRVIGMLDDSPAAKSGLEVGDIVIGLNGWEISDGQEFRYRIAGMAPGTKQEFKILRDGRTQMVTVTLGDQPDDLAKAFGLEGSARSSEPSSADRWGVKVSDMTAGLARRFGYPADTEGVVITGVANAIASRLGIRAGMLVKKVAGVEMKTARDFVAALDGADAKRGVVLYVQSPQGQGMKVLLIGEKPKP